MKTNLKFSLGIALSVLLLTGCQPTEREDKSLEDKKEALSQKLTEMEKNIDEKIAALKKKNERIEKDTKQGVEDALYDLQKKKKEVARSARKLKDATEDNFDDVMKESEKVFEDMSDELKKMGSTIQKWIEEKTD